jgi:CubicO group peptidase (beta-lactamase class C family)
VQSVSGGGHWGGGIFIGTEDHARFGQLVLQDGAWAGRRVLPEGWVARMLTPSRHNPGYGLLWWLNGGERPRHPPATPGSAFALGGGAHAIWIERDWEMVSVVRWIERGALDGFMARLAAARLR